MMFRLSYTLSYKGPPKQIMFFEIIHKQRSITWIYFNILHAFVTGFIAPLSVLAMLLVEEEQRSLAPLLPQPTFTKSVPGCWDL